MTEPKIRNMEEFAAICGVSRPTVSKYFNDANSVRQTTRERIEAALERYDYRPNIFAVNQNRKLTKNVGIVVPYLADPFFTEIARRIERRCIEAGFWPTLFSSHGRPALEIEILDNLRQLKPAGVLLAPLGRASDRGAIEAFCRDVPTILFDSNLEGLGQAFVGSDNFSFVSQSVDYLTRSGSAPIFFEMATPANPNANKRRNAYLSKMQGLGQTPNVISVPGEGWEFEDIGFRGASRLLADGRMQGQTILCSNDRLAIGVLSACYEAGLRVGLGADAALRVASHDDHPFSRFTSPSLTTVAHDYDAVSNKAVEILIDMTEAGGDLGQRTEFLFAARLVLRSSA